MRRRDRGATFVITLVILLGLVAVLMSAMANQRQGEQEVLARTEGQRARLVAEAGVQLALASIAHSQPDATGTTATSGSTSDRATLNTQEWATVGDSGNQKIIVGGGSFRIQIIDASSFLNVNTIKEDQLNRLPLTQEQIDSWLDYREASTTARSDGAKDEYYSALPQPYNAALRRMETVDTLLQVKGFTPELLFQPPTTTTTSGIDLRNANGDQISLSEIFTASSYAPNTDPDGTAKRNINAQGTTAQTLTQSPVSLPQDLATQIASRKNWAGLSDILALPGATNADVRKSILNYLTISAGTRIEGLINLNTATEPVLSAIPQLTPDMVQSVIQRQSQGFTTLGDLADIPGFTGTALQDVADLFTVTSQSFLARIIGTVGGQSRTIEAFIEVRDGTPVVVQTFDPPFTNMKSRWNWQDDTTSELTLAEGV